MARQWFAIGELIDEDGETEYAVVAVVVSEDQAAAPAGRTTKNTDAYPLGVNHGMSFRMPRVAG